MSEALEQEIRLLRARFWSERDPDGRAFAPLADAYLRKGEPGEALALVEDGLDRLPEFATGHLVAARIHQALGDPDSALDSLDRLDALDGSNSSGVRLRAEIMEDEGRTLDAVRHFRRALHMNPAWEDLVGRIARLEAAADGDPPAGEAFSDLELDPSLELDPDLGVGLEDEVGDELEGGLETDPETDLEVGPEVESRVEAEVEAGTDAPLMDESPVDDAVAADLEADLETEDTAAVDSEADDSEADETESEFFFESFSPEPPRDDGSTEGTGESRRPELSDTVPEDGLDLEDLPADDPSAEEPSPRDPLAPELEEGDGELEDPTLEGAVLRDDMEEWTPLELDAADVEVEPSIREDDPGNEEPGAASGRDEMEDTVRDFALEEWEEEEWEEGSLAGDTVADDDLTDDDLVDDDLADDDLADDDEVAEVSVADATGDEPAAPATATRTLGELYARQGETAQAIRVFEQLLERNPGDEALELRLAELRAEADPTPETPKTPETPEIQGVAAPSELDEELAPDLVEDEEAALPPPAVGPTIGGFFDDLLAWEPGAVPVESLAPGAVAPDTPAAWRDPVPVEELAPNSEAPVEPRVEPPVEPDPHPAAPDAFDPGPAGLGPDASSTDPESSGPEEDPVTTSPPGDAPEEPGSDGDDLDDFQAWLRSLRS